MSHVGGLDPQKHVSKVNFHRLRDCSRSCLLLMLRIIYENPRTDDEIVPESDDPISPTPKRAAEMGVVTSTEKIRML